MAEDKDKKAGAEIKSFEHEGEVKTIITPSAKTELIQGASTSAVTVTKKTPTHYKAGMHLEKQKFKNTKKTRQLLLSEGLEEGELEREVEISGLDFTVGEDRALSALQILLDRNNYKGNLPSQEITLKQWESLRTTPAQAFTWTEYFEAYGLKKSGGRYKGRQVENAKKDLDSLATKARRLVYKRKRWETVKGKFQEVVDRVNWKGTLIQILEGYEGLTKEEDSLLDADQDIKTRKHKVAVVFAPIFIDGILDYFLLKPVKLHQEIKDIAGKRVSPATIRFISYLLTLDFTHLSIAKERLIERVGLDYLLKERQKTRVEKILQESFDIAKKAGYLLDYGQDEYGLLHFQLNPERLRPKKRRGKPKAKEITGEKDSR